VGYIFAFFPSGVFVQPRVALDTLFPRFFSDVWLCSELQRLRDSSILVHFTGATATGATALFSTQLGQPRAIA
jgi:hypothetical protein